MKEATGELNMTVVTIVAIAAVALLFYVFLWPVIQRQIVNQTCKTYGADWEAVEVTTEGKTQEFDTGSNAKVSKWACCQKTQGADGKSTVTYDSNKCKSADNN